MRYINKHTFHHLAHSINVQFLKDCYQGPALPMLPAVESNQSYEDFKKPKYRNGDGGRSGWQDLLLQEQDSMCCYCMRKLRSGSISYEHVIPRSDNSLNKGKQDFQLYTSSAPALRDYVVLADAFSKSLFKNRDDIDGVVRFPHNTALANLLAACKGVRGNPNNNGCCCNHSREDAFLLPIMLMADCETRVDYDANGLFSLTSKEPSWEEVKKELNNETLTSIREVWYRISRTDYTLASVESLNTYIERVILFKRAFDVDNFELLPPHIKQFAGSPDNRMDADFYWRLLLDYDWFHSFYRSRQMP